MSEKANILKAVAAYVPSDVVRRALEGNPPDPGQAEPIEAAVLFADVAGFTTMSERMVRALSDQSPHEGHRGSEELNRLLNETFNALMQPVVERCGIVSRFSGDALTAYFERLPDTPPEAVTACALSCANTMQQMMEPFLHAQVAGHAFPISVKIGLSYGPALRLTVGDVRRGLESVLAGPALDMASLAEKHAQQGEVLVSQETLDRLPAQPAVRQRRDRFAVIDGDPPGAPRPTPCPLNLDDLETAQRERLREALKPHLPPEVYQSLALTGGDLPGDFRRVTSIFVGFEGLRFDSPAVGPALQDYFTWAQGIVARFEGRLNRVITGDKGSVLHILFGAPGKHDDDPVRALRCALALKTDPARPPSISSQRIGIASGIVLARPLGSAIRREYTVIGDEINLSSRLMTAGKRGDILVDSYTRDRTAQRFTFENLPPMQLKGKRLPVKAYRLLAERKTVTGLTSRYLSSRWALVGRDTERARLLAVADRALDGHGHVIALSGRAGVGKTRLVEEVVRHWVDRGGDGYIGQSQSHGANSPYLPWIDLWRVFFGFLEADDPAARWHKVRSLVEREVPHMSQWAGVLGSLLGLPQADSPAIAALDAADRRQKLFDLALALVRARAARQPLLLLFEDLHWADQPSLALIDHVAAQIDDVPVLLCLCYRPRDDFDPSALHLPHCTWLSLTELPAGSSAQMIQAVLNQADLPSEFEQEIYDKTQGNPLFVEELLASLIESGLLARVNGGYQVTGNLSRARVPDTLQDLIMARIDRLEPPSRDLLQVASVIDRRFAYRTLHQIYPYHMADLEMRDRLEATIQMDITRLYRPEPELAYLFKHAMAYEVAYNSLPFARRRQLHERVGEFLETANADDLEPHYPALAYHFSQGERWDKTLTYALAAGAQAQELYANDEALRYYQQAERCLEKLPGEKHWREALALYLNRNVIYRLKGQYDRCEADIRQALELAQTHDDTRAQAQAYNLLAELRWWQERNEETLQFAQTAYDLVRPSQNDVETLGALRLMGTAHHALGQYEQAMSHFSQAHDLARQLDDQVTLGTILNAIGITHYTLGRFDDALKALQQALDLLQAVDLKHRIAACLSNIGNAQFRWGQPQAALKSHRSAVQTALSGGFHAVVGYFYLSEAETLSYLGKYTQVLELCQQARTAFKQIGDTLGQNYVDLAITGEAFLPLGLHTLARPRIKDPLQAMLEYGNAEQSTYALLQLTECCLRDNDLQAAEFHLQQLNKLSQLPLPTWRLSEQAWLEARLALAHGDWELADALSHKIEHLIDDGSNPDTLGPMWVLRARVAIAQGNRRVALDCFKRGISAVYRHSSLSNRLFVLEKAAAFMLDSPKAEIVAQGKQHSEKAATMQAHLKTERKQVLERIGARQPQ